MNSNTPNLLILKNALFALMEKYEKIFQETTYLETQSGLTLHLDKLDRILHRIESDVKSLVPLGKDFNVPDFDSNRQLESERQDYIGGNEVELVRWIIDRLDNLQFSRLERVDHCLDYDLELRSSERYVNQFSYPHLFRYLTVISDGFGLQRENHGMGYHFHYVVAKSHKRSNVIFTFNPDLGSFFPDSEKEPKLYWERHAEGKTRVDENPDRFDDRRRKDIYKNTKPALASIGIANFKRPSKKAKILYPI